MVIRFVKITCILLVKKQQAGPSCLSGSPRGPSVVNA
jgi:hypothetical protein